MAINPLSSDPTGSYRPSLSLPALTARQAPPASPLGSTAQPSAHDEGVHASGDEVHVASLPEMPHPEAVEEILEPSPAAAEARVERASLEAPVFTRDERATLLPPTTGYATSDHGPVVLVDEAAGPSSAPEVLDAGTRLTHEQHLQLMADAAGRGSETLTLTGPSGVPHEVHVHGASPRELKNIQSSLQHLREVDPHDLLLHDVKDIYVADSLGSSGAGKPVAGVAVKQGDGETAITLSRMAGQASKNRLESPGHVQEVLYHEIGHVVDNAHGVTRQPDSPFGQGDATQTDVGGDFVSKYATTNPKEDFAETFSQFYVARASSCFEGCTDREIVDITLLGSDGRGKAHEKMLHVPEALSPELHVRQHVMGWSDRQREEGQGPRQLVRRFYDDGEFRQQFVDDVRREYPAVPRDAVYSYINNVADLFGEEAAPRTGASS